jgi:hypothetical protein
MDDKKVKSIVLNYVDGNSKEINKGLCMTFVENESEESVRVTYDMVGCSGQDLYTIVEAAISLGMRMGMFKGEADG